MTQVEIIEEEPLVEKPVLHMVAPFHTIVSHEFSHCAFTGKVHRFSKMMRMYGYHVVEYSNGESESEASEKVSLLSKEKLLELRTKKKEDEFVGNDAVIGSPIWQEFNKLLLMEMLKRVKQGDIICYPFGNTHPALATIFQHGVYHVESGIGYPGVFLDMRIYESSAWMHWHFGKENNSNGKNYQWVVPNYYDKEDWDVNLHPQDYVLYFGRITPEKGMNTIVEIAKRINKKVILCGQGDPTDYLDKCANIEYKPPIHGRARSELLGNAYCVLMPTTFIEPFGGAGVEAQMCGTPLIASNYGAFRETVIEGVTGFRCNTLGDWLDAIERVGSLDRQKVADIARSTYSLEACGKLYDKIFMDIANLGDKGWYNEKSFKHYDK